MITFAQLLENPGAQELAEIASPREGDVVPAELMRAALLAESVADFGTDEIARANAAVDRIGSAVAEAESIITAHLAARYTLPLSTVPLLLVRIARSIVRYTLHSHLLTSSDDHPVIRDYKQAVVELNSIARGTMQLGVASTPSPDAGTVQIAHGVQRFPVSDLDAFTR